MQNILITGGTGFIGSRLAQRCLNEGFSVRVFAKTRTPSEEKNASTLRDSGVDFVEGSITDRGALDKACRGIDTVFHLAAAQHEAEMPRQYFHDVNVTGTRNVLEAATAAGVTRFVHGSTIGVYGEPNGKPVTEESPLAPDNVYGETKLEAEHVVREFTDRLAVTVVRISETYGPGDLRLLKVFKGVQHHRFVRIGPGRNLHHPIYIEDLLNGLLLCAQHPKGVNSTFVLAGPAAITTDQMIDEISRAVHVRPTFLRVPLAPLIVGAIVCEKSLPPLGMKPPIHRRRMNFFTKSFRFALIDAVHTIAFHPTYGFAEGARLTAEWYNSMGLL